MAKKNTFLQAILPENLLNSLSLIKERNAKTFSVA